MKEFKIILIAVLFFVLGAGTSVYFVSNVKANKQKYRQYREAKQQKQEEKDKNTLVLDRKKIEFDLTGLGGVNTFSTAVYENGMVRYEDGIIFKAWPDYRDKLTVIIEDGLKKEGLRIVSDAFDENGVPIIPDFISLDINVVRDEPSRTIAGTIELYLNGVFMDYEGKRFVSAKRWDKAQAFMVKETEVPEYIEKVTQSMMNDFIKDYVKANPKKTDTVPSAAPGR